MNTLLIIIASICFISLILLYFIGDNKDSFCFMIGTFLSNAIVLIIGLIISILETDKIPAIEVYRGNTTLQITYQDNIPIDSVVVYKNK